MDRKFEQGLNGEGVEGVPQEVWENPADYEEGLPFIRKTVRFVKQFSTSRLKGKEITCDQQANVLLKDPTLIKPFFDNLDLLTQLKPTLPWEDIKTSLINHLEHSASNRSMLQSWTPSKIEQLVELADLRHGELPKVISRIVAGLFNAPRTIEDSVDLHYNTAWAMATTNNVAVQEDLFSLLCLERDIFTPDSFSAVLFTQGGLSLSDVHVGRYFAVMDALDYTGILLETKATGEILVDSQRAWDRVIQLKEAMANPHFKHRVRFSAVITDLHRKNPQRFQRLYDAVDKDEVAYPLEHSSFQGKDYIETLEKSRKYLESYDAPIWPSNVIRNPDEPLRKLVFGLLGPKIFKTMWEQYKIASDYKAITERGLTFAGNHKLEIAARNIRSTEERNAIAREVYDTLIKGKTESHFWQLKAPMNRIIEFLELAEKRQFGFWEEFDSDKNIVFCLMKNLPGDNFGRLSLLLEYHRPPLSLELVKSIDSQVRNIREELQKGFVRSIGKRGYTIAVTDPNLRRFGYESITVKQKPVAEKIEVKMIVDKEEYSFDLSGDYMIKHEGDIKQFASPQDQAWFEILVLSHLKKLICTGDEEEKLKPELVGGQKQYERYRRQIGRREHLRRLSPGKNYSSDAFNRCLKSHFKLSLFQINKWKAEAGKGGTKETGVWTYVSGTEYLDSPEAKPIKIAFKGASEDIRQVIDLGQVSEEEMSRIENEILGELEKTN